MGIKSLLEWLILFFVAFLGGSYVKTTLFDKAEFHFNYLPHLVIPLALAIGCWLISEIIRKAREKKDN